MNILKSATKIVLILLIISVIIFTWLWIEITEPLKTVTLMVVSFYFWSKNGENKEVSTEKNG